MASVIIAIVAVVALLIAIPVTYKVAIDNKTKKDAEVIGTAEEKARSIIDEALKAADSKKREALLEVKEESLRTRNELEKETKERRADLQTRSTGTGKNFRSYLRTSKRTIVKICRRRRKS